MSDGMTDPREPLGRIVHEQRLAFEQERSALKDRPGFLMHPWEERHPEQRELDMRIGAAVAAAAVAGAEAKLATILALPRLYIGTVDEGNATVSYAAILAIIGSEEEAPAADVGHPSAADRTMVSRATSGGIRGGEVQVKFSDEEGADHG